MSKLSIVPKAAASAAEPSLAGSADMRDVIRVFDERHRVVLGAIADAIEPHIDGVLNDFYGTLGCNPETAKILANGPGVEALKKAQRAHWKMLLAGELSDELMERGRRIGIAHVKVGLQPDVYIAGYAFLFSAFLKAALADQPAAVESATALARDLHRHGTGALGVPQYH